MSISFLHNSAIDIQKWDSIINAAVNERVYAESWYLDIVAPDWYGLVYDNYRYVMPVVIRKKLGFSYAFQPVYAQQHGIFPPSTPTVTTAFMEKIHSLCSFYEICFNALNRIPLESLSTEAVARKNYVLYLNAPYGELVQNYSRHSLRHVRKSKKHCTFAESVTVEQYINLKNKFGHRGIRPQHIKTLRLIMNQSIAKGRGQILGAYDEHNQLCAAAFFLKENKRSIYLNSVSTPQGKNLQAMYGIIDHIIERNAAQNKLLDFEGSNIEGIARFFAGFGASPETYYLLKGNRLKWPFSYFKR